MSKIERVAKAMYERMEGQRSNIVAKWEDMHLPVRMHFMDGARAAIEAMREPTREMLVAGAKGSGEDSETVALGAWEAMIEVAIGRCAKEYAEKLT